MVGWHHRLDGHEFEQLQETEEDRGTWCSAICGSQRVRHDLETEQQQCKETQMYGYSTDWQNVNGDPDHPAVYV